MILIGRDGPLIGSALGERVVCHEAGSMSEAVGLASELAHPGDLVLLSPACASFDLFSSYEERGLRFKGGVRSL